MAQDSRVGKTLNMRRKKNQSSLSSPRKGTISETQVNQVKNNARVGYFNDSLVVEKNRKTKTSKVFFPFERGDPKRIQTRHLFQVIPSWKATFKARES